MLTRLAAAFIIGCSGVIMPASATTAPPAPIAYHSPHLAPLERSEQTARNREAANLAAEKAKLARLHAKRLELERRVATLKRASRSATQPAPSNWAYLINQYPWDTVRATRIMLCESGGNPNAHNSSDHNGLFQIHHGPFDPAANVALAYSMFQRSGWTPWVCK